MTTEPKPKNPPLKSGIITLEKALELLNSETCTFDSRWQILNRRDNAIMGSGWTLETLKPLAPFTLQRNPFHA